MPPNGHGNGLDCKYGHPYEFLNSSINFLLKEGK